MKGLKQRHNNIVSGQRTLKNGSVFNIDVFIVNQPQELDMNRCFLIDQINKFITLYFVLLK